MDLYRYFHPHHNPRLLRIPLRLQELGELEQAATELKKAVRRAAIRADNASKSCAGETYEEDRELRLPNSSALPEEQRIEAFVKRTEGPRIRLERLSEILNALEFVVDSLANLSNEHPGDEVETMHALLSERGEAPGWENWTRLLEQRLELMQDEQK